MGDVANAERELEWQEEEVRKYGTGNHLANFEGDTINDELMAYRRRLEELKKAQQEKGSSASNSTPQTHESTVAK